MRKVKDIEKQIRRLSDDEYAELRDWFLERDRETWGAKLEADVRCGGFLPVMRNDRCFHIPDQGGHEH